MGKFTLQLQPPIPTPEEAANRILLGSSVNNSERIAQLPIKYLLPFEKHPFEVQSDKVADLRESIKQQGIISPLFVREMTQKTGYYEIISGHHRYEAAKLEHLELLPCIIKNISDDEATLLMIDTNIQRGFQDMKPSELANAMKLRYDTLSHQGKRTDLMDDKEASGQVGQKLGEEHRMSARNVRRYIALTNLIPVLMNFVDNKILSFLTGVELSYLKKENQEIVADYIMASESKITLEQAENLKLLDREDIFPKELDKFFNPLKAELTTKREKKKTTIKFKIKEVEVYIPQSIIENGDIETYILNALNFYQDYQKKENIQ